MDSNQQYLFFAGAKGELSTFGAITPSMTEEQAVDINTVATIQFLEVHPFSEFPSPVEAILAFRAWLVAGGYKPFKPNLDIHTVSLTISIPGPSGVAVQFGAVGAIGDTDLMSAFVVLYDEVTKAVNGFRKSRNVGKPSDARGNSDTQGNRADSETIDITSIRVEERNGKRYARAVGGRWVKFGVAVWPEVATAAGVSMDEYELGENPVKMKAVIALDVNGKPEKVTQLIP